MTVYYAADDRTVRKTLEVDKTKYDFIPYKDYEELYEEHRFDGILTCDCGKNQISWESFTKEVYITDDAICSRIVLIAYNYCYYDPICRNGPLGNIIYYHLQSLCEKAELLYPAVKTDIGVSLTSGTVLTNDELYGVAYSVGLALKKEVQRAFQASYRMTYPLYNNETQYFYNWALSTTIADVQNETYWSNFWGLNYNTSYRMAESWLDLLDESYFILDDAIEDAFLSDVQIIYKYTNNASYGTTASNKGTVKGYYQLCAPFQCIWVTTAPKSIIEIATAIFAILGGIHAVMFVVINIVAAIYRKCKGIQFHSEIEEKQKLEMTQAQAIMKDTSDGTAM